MPEMSFRVRWPDESESDHYSPSLVIKDFFNLGEEIDIPAFLTRARAALTIASDRVREKYGFPCARAGATLAGLEHRSAAYATQSDARIKIMEFST